MNVGDALDVKSLEGVASVKLTAVSKVKVSLVLWNDGILPEVLEVMVQNFTVLSGSIGAENLVVQKPGKNARTPR